MTHVSTDGRRTVPRGRSSSVLQPDELKCDLTLEVGTRVSLSDSTPCVSAHQRYKQRSRQVETPGGRS